jgi:hypothetical protein
MHTTRKWLAVLAAVAATCACSSTSTTPTAAPTRFTLSGEGNAAAAIADTVLQLQVTAVSTGQSANFAVWIGPLSAPCGTAIAIPGCRQLVNQQLGTSTNQLTYSALVSTGSGGSSTSDTLTIQSSGLVNWSFVQTQ